MTDFVDKGLHTWEGAIASQGEGWRLPTIFELIDLGWKGYWSSSPVAGFASLAWNVLFYHGSDNANSKSNGYFHVRLVRGEPSSELEPVTMEEAEQYKEAYELQRDICEKYTTKENNND